MNENSNTPKGLILRASGYSGAVHFVTEANVLTQNAAGLSEVARNTLFQVARAMTDIKHVTIVFMPADGKNVEVTATHDGKSWTVKAGNATSTHPRSNTKRPNSSAIDNGPDVLSLTSYVLREVVKVTFGVRQPKKALSPEAQALADEKAKLTAQLKAIRAKYNAAAGIKPRKPAVKPEDARKNAAAAREAARGKKRG